MKLDKITMVHHHVCYEEIRGYELVILMPFGEHVKLHRRLRKENKCNVSIDELYKISKNSKCNRKINSTRSKKYNKNVYHKKFHFYNRITYNFKIKNNL